ncbi:hypothetical protein VpaJT1_59 [Vibrio phage VpaJT_1]|nr:hypothetical protein VpaJT1_59 [Vibrio phage VpaJT_1]
MYTWDRDYDAYKSSSNYYTYNRVMASLQKIVDRDGDGALLRRSFFRRLCKRLNISQHLTYKALQTLKIINTQGNYREANFPLHILGFERDTAYTFDQLRVSPTMTCPVKGQTSMVRAFPYSDEKWCGEALFFKWQTLEVNFNVVRVEAIG